MARFQTTLVLLAIAFVAWQVQPFEGLALVAAGERHERHFNLCSESIVRDNCVVDGDTFWLEGEKVRIANIDTPETHPARCPYEARLGGQATQRLYELLNAGPIELHAIDRDRDVYGRLLRTVEGANGDVGGQLVDEGLARPYAGGRRPWC